MNILSLILLKRLINKFTQINPLLYNMKVIKKKWYFLEWKRWNNSFAYFLWKKLWIPEVDIWLYSDLKLWKKIVFADEIDGEYNESIGLEKHLWILNDSNYDLVCPVFVCDNHNRVLEAWKYFKMNKPVLVHIDQHRDEASPWGVDDFEKDLRVCDYINWAKKEGWINQQHLSFCESKDFNNSSEVLVDSIILNIDLDIFAPEQTIIPYKKIWETILKFSKKSCLITIATSPLFIDQNRAIKLLNKFFEFFLKKQD